MARRRDGARPGGVTVALFGCVMLVAPAAAADLRLEDALSRAFERNPALLAAAADVEAAAGAARQAGLPPANPVVAGEGANHRVGSASYTDRGISLSQEVEVGGQRGLRVAAARHDVARTEHLLADRRRSIAAEVRRAFAGLVAADRRRTLAGEAASLTTRLAAAVHRRLTAGDTGALDGRLAEVEVARATQAVTTAETERARAAARLAAAVGAEPDEPIGAIAGDVPPSPPAEPALVAHALDVRPDLQAAREQRARLDAEADAVHRKGWVPNPVFRAFYRDESGDERIAGGEVSLPIPVWNREQGTEVSLRASARAAAAEVVRLEREIPREVHVALVRRTTASTAWDRFRDAALPAAAAADDLIQRAYAGGYSGLSEVLVQQDRLLQVRTAAIAAWLDLHEADADLREAAGEDIP